MPEGIVIVAAPGRVAIAFVSEAVFVAVVAEYIVMTIRSEGVGTVVVF